MPEMRTLEGRERLSLPVTVTLERPGRDQTRAERRRNAARPVQVRNGLPPFRPYAPNGDRTQAQRALTARLMAEIGVEYDA